MCRFVFTVLKKSLTPLTCGVVPSPMEPFPPRHAHSALAREKFHSAYDFSYLPGKRILSRYPNGIQENVDLELVSQPGRSTLALLEIYKTIAIQRVMATENREHSLVKITDALSKSACNRRGILDGFTRSFDP